jgi:hypothetical protein
MMSDAACPKGFGIQTLQRRMVVGCAYRRTAEICVTMENHRPQRYETTNERGGCRRKFGDGYIEHRASDAIHKL